MKRLIVNADDFGLTSGINRGIIEGHRKGIITSTSAMANGLQFEEAVAFAKANPKLGVGVHLALVDGRPVSDQAAVPSLLNAAGNFLETPLKLLKRLITGEARQGEIQRELRAQVEKAMQAFGSVTHLDGHKHLHIYPKLFRIVVSIAKDYGIRHIRYPVEEGTSWLRIWQQYRTSEALLQYIRSRLIAGMARLTRKSLLRNGFSPPETVIGIAQTGLLNCDSLRSIIASLSEGTTELICHPGYVDDGLRQLRTRLVLQRELELKALSDPGILNLIAAHNIQLINYRDL